MTRQKRGSLYLAGEQKVFTDIRSVYADAVNSYRRFSLTIVNIRYHIVRSQHRSRLQPPVNDGTLDFSVYRATLVHQKPDVDGI